MPEQINLAYLLPHAMIVCPHAQLALFTIRRMGAHGLADARAAQAMLTGFGRGFRRPLTFTRALIADMATTATGAIAIAPCCCSRMTPAERDLLAALACVETRPDRAGLLLADVLGSRRVEGTIASVAAVAAAYADGGRPIG